MKINIITLFSDNMNNFCSLSVKKINNNVVTGKVAICRLAGNLSKKKLIIHESWSLVTQESLYRATRTGNWRERKFSVSGSSVNGGYFARTSCATIINQLKVFDIIPPLAVGEVTFHKHVYFAFCAAIELSHSRRM